MGRRMHNVGWIAWRPERRAREDRAPEAGRLAAHKTTPRGCIVQSQAPLFREPYAVFRFQVIARFLYESFMSRERLFFDDVWRFAYNALTFDLEVRFVTGPQGLIPEEG